MRAILILLSFFVAIPCFAGITDESNRVSQASFIRGTAGLDVKEVSSVECRADSSGNLGGKYFVIYSANDATKYAPWYDVDDGSSAPTVSGATLIEIDIATDDIAGTVCGATKTALEAITGTPFVVSGTTTLTITNSDYGPSTDIADGDTTHTDISKTTDGAIGTAAAITSTDIIADIRGFELCNDAVNTSTYLIYGWSTPVTDTGGRLGKGKCFICENCKAGVLSSMYVAGQAASNGYSIAQFRKQ